MDSPILWGNTMDPGGILEDFPRLAIWKASRSPHVLGLAHLVIFVAGKSRKVRLESMGKSTNS